jgi:hypothetical protein
MDHGNILRQIILLFLRPHQLVTKANRDLVRARPVPTTQSIGKLSHVRQVRICDKIGGQIVPIWKHSSPIAL